MATKIKPIKIKTLEGFNRNVIIQFKIISTDPLIKMKKYVDAFTGLGAGLDRNGFPVTGLTEDWTDPQVGNKIPKRHKGTRKAMEALLDLEEGTLKQSGAHWHRYSIRMTKDTEQFDLTNDHDLLKYLFALAQSNVADGFAEIKSNSKAEFVLYSEQQEAEQRVATRSVLKKAYILAEELDTQTKINILSVYGIIADATAEAFITDKIDEKIEEGPQDFLNIANDGHLLFKSLITKCLDKGILTLEDGSVMHGEIPVGYSREDAASKMEKDNQLVAILKAKLSGNLELIQGALKG